MALRLLGRKLMIVKPQKLGFYFRNSSHTAVVHDNPPSDSHARICPSVNLVMEYSVRPDQYEDDVLEENCRLKEGNCQLIENCRLKAENRQLIENSRLKEENRRLIERLKTVEEEIIGVLQHDTNKDSSRKTGEMNKIREMNLMDIRKENLKDDASNTINELFEKVTRLEEKILGDLHRDIQNERDGWKSLETKLEEALRKIEKMNKEQKNLITKLENASNTMNELIEKVRPLEIRKRPCTRAVQNGKFQSTGYSRGKLLYIRPGLRSPEH